MRYRLLSEYGFVLWELSLRKLTLFLDDLGALCPMFRGCFFGMNDFDDTADAQYILSYHGCYVKCQALILQKLSIQTPYQLNRRKMKLYEVELRQQGCLSSNFKFSFHRLKMHLCETSDWNFRMYREESAGRRIDRKHYVPWLLEMNFEKTIALGLPSGL